MLKSYKNNEEFFFLLQCNIYYFKGEPSSKAKYYKFSDSAEYREGKV